MKRKLITSALPYVNNIPHLGNLIQVLSADVFARFCRSRGYKTMYVCGTDEYGTATETRALEEGKTPKELCDYYHAIHKDIYEWFGINFDHFGRTSTEQQTEIVQSLFKALDERGFISENTIEQLYCEDCKRFLADRYVRGTCPHCGYDDARGDQCEHCGKLLEPTELKEARCSTCSHSPVLKSTKHLYINLPAIQKEYTPWMKEASEKGMWAKNAVQMTQAWIRDGLHERAITRDLKWGIPVPKPGFEDKVFYVWFDAPIGYISITKALCDMMEQSAREGAIPADTVPDWKSWWLPAESKAPDAKEPVELFQFIGKDNIPFHTVIFPSTLIGSGKDWTKLFHMSSTEYLNYESGKFSKSKGVGVFGSDAKESGIPADMWRFYIFYNRPEKSDTQFTWKDFQDKVNSELVGNLANLVNRTTTFVSRYYGGKIPEGKSDEALWEKVREAEKRITDLYDRADLKDAFHEIFALSSIANKAFQDGEPWKTRESAPEKAASLIRDLCYIIKDLMILVHPVMPQYAEKVLGFFGKKGCTHKIGIPAQKDALLWDNVGLTEGLSEVVHTEIIFTPLDNAKTDAYRKRYAGTQAERAKGAAQSSTSKAASQSASGAGSASGAAKSAPKKNEPVIAEDPVSHFNQYIQLKTAKILKAERHPDADKLYIETIDDGSGTERIILSGLVPYFTAEELTGRDIIIADNLKPRKMRGIESRGMLLAADYTDSEGKTCVEILGCPGVPPGTPLVFSDSGSSSGAASEKPAVSKPAEIDADVFFACPMKIEHNKFTIGGKVLSAAGKEITTGKTVSGDVH
ncbi:methionine--tRNA ligase [Treponema sp. OMZ 840]|uniref:methionine--tRNA ligase n=1 Tax=Treponema sp. OMZ 840 TaxID=244313 RepID=UPI003D8A4340